MKVLRKGKKGIITNIDNTIDPPDVTVKMLDKGNFVGTELKFLTPCDDIDQPLILNKVRYFFYIS